MKNKLLPFLLLAFSTLNLSCGQIATSLVAPNQCKKCEVVNDHNGTIGWVEEACGGEVYNLEMRAKVAAYDLGCNYRVKCQTWKKETVE